MPNQDAAVGRAASSDPGPRPIQPRGATSVPFERPDPLPWRAQLRANPVTRPWFRVSVAVVGVALIIAAPLTGPLPGPGGIPLFLAGMAVLATEFLWARNLRQRLMRYVRIYLAWPKAGRRLFWVAFVGCCGLVYYLVLVLFGLPGWVPGWLADWLLLLPGVS